VLPFDGIDERAAERYRVVRTRLIQLPSHPKVICLSSAGPGDGKSVNAVNLAGALALKSDHAVLLIDSDLRQATLARLLGLPAGPGLSEVLSKQIEWHQAIVRIVEAPNLFILCAGELKLNPAELLDSREWKALCESVRTYFDHVVVDSPPMGVVADYDLIASACDGVIIVARQDHSNLSRLRKCIQTARSNQLIGVLMNYVEPSPFWKNHDDTAYGYGYPTAKK
jgi:capsular exopolysaccharide synthesis family protein